jgi:hypothetical protein
MVLGVQELRCLAAAVAAVKVGVAKQGRIFAFSILTEHVETKEISFYWTASRNIDWR